jgi:hypothetical protein
MRKAIASLIGLIAVMVMATPRNDEQSRSRDAPASELWSRIK